MCKFLIAFLLFCVSNFACYAEDAKSGLNLYLYETAYGEQLNYQAYLPEMLTPNLPVVLFLHGSGERGSDNKVQTKHVVPQLIHYIKTHEPCIVIAPQCPSKQQWVNVSWNLQEHRMPEFPSTPMRLSLELLDETVSKYQANAKRIYIVGLSMGGYGTWDAIQRKQTYFAAAVPICGGGDVEQGHKLTHLPIWAWHGDKDNAVPVFRSRSMIEAIKKSGGAPVYTELEGVGHNVWTPASEHSKLWEWLFSQTLN